MTWSRIYDSWVFLEIGIRTYSCLVPFAAYWDLVYIDMLHPQNAWQEELWDHAVHSPVHSLLEIVACRFFSSADSTTEGQAFDTFEAVPRILQGSNSLGNLQTWTLLWWVVILHRTSQSQLGFELGAVDLCNDIISTVSLDTLTKLHIEGKHIMQNETTEIMNSDPWTRSIDHHKDWSIHRTMLLPYWSASCLGCLIVSRDSEGFITHS